MIAQGGAGSPEGVERGCEKVDFLFVVDGSPSMVDQLRNLAQSFPGFIEQIRDVVGVEDYHIMVVAAQPADGTYVASNKGCRSKTFTGCVSACQFSPCKNTTCNGQACTEYPTPSNADYPCDEVQGAGVVAAEYNTGDECGIIGGQRYIQPGQPDLGPTFSCIAELGSAGVGQEKPMEAMQRALSDPMNATGGCNEAFLRDDALLVVTVITDEDDDYTINGGDGVELEHSIGEPQDWHQSVVQAKHDDETAAVVLALVNDSGTDNPICESDHAGTDGKRLRQFADLFTYGSSSSVCAEDFSPFFGEAISVIDTACEEYEPPVIR